MNRPPAFTTLLSLARPPLTTRSHARLAIDGPCGLPNARDLATASPNHVRSNLIYRGSTPAKLPEHPSEEAVAFLRSVPTFVDLRSRDERRTDRHAQIMSACGADFLMRETHISLLNKRRIVLGLAKTLPSDQARALALRSVLRPLRAREGIVRRMDEGGLLLLNRILVEMGASGIGRTLRLITDSATRGGRVYFYCSAGKDRTGLMAALILSVLGVSRSEIIRDYAKSSETWENGPYHLREEYCGMCERFFELRCSVVVANRV